MDNTKYLGTQPELVMTCKVKYEGDAGTTSIPYTIYNADHALEISILTWIHTLITEGTSRNADGFLARKRHSLVKLLSGKDTEVVSMVGSSCALCTYTHMVKEPTPDGQLSDDECVGCPMYDKWRSIDNDFTHGCLEDNSVYTNVLCGALPHSSLTVPITDMIREYRNRTGDVTPEMQAFLNNNMS